MHVRTAAALSLVLTMFSGASPARAAAPAEAFAEAVKACFDSPDEAAVRLETLHAAHPDDDDVAWWLARVRLDAGRVEEARVLLEGRVGRKVPAWRFGWLRARTLAAVDPARARVLIEDALRDAADDLEGRDARALAARLALDAGDVAAAARHVAAGASGPLAFWRRSGAPGALLVERDGQRWWVSEEGLAVPEPLWTAATGAGTIAAGEPREGRGPDLVDAGGRPCLLPGSRTDPAPGPTGWLYAAAQTPEGEGIFEIDTCGGAPRRVRAGTGLSSPAWLDGGLVWVESGTARTEAAAPWPLLSVLRLASGRSGLLLVVWERGAPRLRWAASLESTPTAVFVDDPPITRARWSPSPSAGRSPGAPPPPRAHLR